MSDQERGLGAWNVWFIARVLARTLATIPAMYARLARDMWRERKQDQV